jgi:flagellin
MGLRIRTNVASLQAQRGVANATNSLRDSMAQLSSGYRINKAADDAAGLAISTALTGRVRSLEQAARNANDGVSMVQVAESGMNEISNVLTRLRELAVQASSDTIGNAERSYANREYTQLVEELDRITNTTEFNGVKLLKGADANVGDDLLTIHVGGGDGKAANTDTIRIDINDMKLIPEDDFGLGRGSEIGPLEVGDAFDRQTATEKLSVIDSAMQRLASTRANMGAQQNRLQSAVTSLSSQIENYRAANSRIRDVDFASASASFTQSKILQQAGVSVLAQANSEPEAALALLR